MKTSKLSWKEVKERYNVEAVFRRYVVLVGMICLKDLHICYDVNSNRIYQRESVCFLRNDRVYCSDGSKATTLSGLKDLLSIITCTCVFAEDDFGFAAPCLNYISFRGVFVLF